MDEKKISFERHDLLYLDEGAKRFAVENAITQHKDLVQELIGEIPAIVRRQEQPIAKYIGVGFSSYKIMDGVRVKVSGSVPVNGIIKVMKPEEVFQAGVSESTGFLSEMLGRIDIVGAKNKVVQGLYGSLALNIITKKPYLNENSDIDIFIKFADIKLLKDYYREISEISKKFDRKADIEADIGEGYAVKLAELLSEQKTVMAKGLYDVQIFDIEQIRRRFG